MAVDSSSVPTFPTTGTITSGVTYEFCLDVLNWTSASANWFHGVEIILGAGWDPASVVPTVNPTSCSADGGNWDFYPTVTGSATGLVFGQGWYYDSGVGGPLDGDPGNNFGDNCSASGTWNFCFEVTTLSGLACVDGADLTIGFNTLGDSESGSWGSYNCNLDADILWSGPLLACCEPPDLNITDPLCFGESTGAITATGTSSGPYTFDFGIGTPIISMDSATVDGLSSGVYTLILTDSASCITSTVIELFDPPILEIIIDSTTEIRCPGGSDGAIYASGLGGTGTYDYAIDGGVTQITGAFTGLAVGTYVISIFDENGCETTETVILSEDNILAITVDNVIDASCFEGMDGLIEVSGSGGYPPYSYSIDGYSYQPFNSFSGLTAGDYTVHVMDDNGCDVTTFITIVEPVLLVVDAGTYIPIPSGDDVDLFPTTNAGIVASWMWTPPDGLNCTDCQFPNSAPEETIWYTLTIIDDAGCVAYDSTEIVVVNSVIIPNAFTPNGDGLNDVFQIVNPNISDFTMSIYDRWGEIIFQTADINVGWDGTKQGYNVELGAYIYVINASSKEGTPINRTGTITILR
ncbi:MAG: gliding motility-associated-like protein [Limisphaerales bacterium]|jgi:gliding motility-associated-like protein